MTILPKKIYRYNAISIKVRKVFFHRTETNHSKICVKTWRPWIVKTILKKKNKAWSTIAIKTVQYWHKTRHTNQWNTMESPEKTLTFTRSINLWKGLPRYPCQCRRCKRWGFNPWAGEIPWSRKWQSSPVFLPGKFHRLGSYIVHGVSKSRTQLSACTHIHTHTHTQSMTKKARIYNGEEIASPINGTGKTCKRIKLDYFLIPCIRINSKWIKYLNVNTQNHETLRRKHRQYAL